MLCPACIHCLTQPKLSPDGTETHTPWFRWPMSYALSQRGLQHATIPSHSQSQRYTFPYSGARSQQWMFTQQPALTQSVYLSVSSLKLILESPKDAIDSDFAEGCAKCYHNCESCIKCCHWLALRSTTCATWYFIIHEQKNTFNVWQKGRIVQNIIIMHTAWPKKKGFK